MEGKTAQLLLFVSRNVMLRHPAQNVRLLVASVIVHLLPLCARLHCQEKAVASFDFEEEELNDDTWKDDIKALFDDGQHMEVSLNCRTVSNQLLVNLMFYIDFCRL